MRQFTWQPGIGIDPVALAGLRSHFGRPPYPMGEAWFMGETRHMFRELMADLSNLTARDLRAPLEEIASGASSLVSVTNGTTGITISLASCCPAAMRALSVR